MATIFADIFERGRNSDCIAIIGDENKVTYRDLIQSSFDFAESLSAKLPARPIVAVSANHGPAYVRGLLACITINAVIVPINPSAPLREKLHVLEDCGADALLLEDSEEYWGTASFSGVGLTLYLAKLSMGERNLPFGSRMMIYTSGTTSRPKGVLLSDRSLSCNIKAVANNFGLSPGDRTIIFSPPAYAMAMTQIFSFLWAGGSLVCWPHGLRYPAEIVRIIETYGITALTLSPSAARIIQKSVRLDGKSFPTVRYVSSGGMPLYLRDVSWYGEKFPNARVVNFYGCTENSPRISHYWVPRVLDVVADTALPVGQALEGVEIMIGDSEGNALPPGSVGEIHLKGSSLMVGYWRNEEMTSMKFNQDWFRTGDRGSFDSSGNLTLYGRVDNVFSVGHEKVAPEEIEAFMAKLAGVEEVVIGQLPDALLDSVPVALVVSSRDPSVMRAEILEQCRQNLSPAKVPRVVIFVQEIPKTHYGKIDRKAAQSLMEGHIGKSNE